MAEEQEDEDFTYFVRIGNTDLDGTESIETALLEADGVGRRVAKATINKINAEPGQVLGSLNDTKIDKIKQTIEEFQEMAPSWMLNRRKDMYTGEDRHLVGVDVERTEERDIERMKEISSYKGIRHQQGKKVRGQKTRSTGREDTEVAVEIEELRKEEEQEEEE